MEEQIFEMLLNWLNREEMPAAPEGETLPAQVPGVTLTLTQTRDLAIYEDVIGCRSIRTRFVYSLRFRLPMEVGRGKSQAENRRRLDALTAQLRREAIVGDAPVFGEKDSLTLTYPRLESVREGTGVYTSMLTLESTFDYKERMN